MRQPHRRSFQSCLRPSKSWGAGARGGGPGSRPGAGRAHKASEASLAHALARGSQGCPHDPRPVGCVSSSLSSWVTPCTPRLCRGAERRCQVQLGPCSPGQDWALSVVLNWPETEPWETLPSRGSRGAPPAFPPSSSLPRKTAEPEPPRPRHAQRTAAGCSSGSPGRRGSLSLGEPLARS